MTAGAPGRAAGGPDPRDRAAASPGPHPSGAGTHGAFRVVLRAFRKAARRLDPLPVAKLLVQLWRNRRNRDALFLWVPKTAGTSLFSVLQRHGAVMMLDAESIRSYSQNRGICTFGHISIPALLEAGLLSPDYFRRAWKFSFVRNPYDRAVSLFHYMIQEGRLPPATSFAGFCSRLERKEYEPVGLHNRSGLSQINAQSAWLFGADGRPLCDFVGRMENLAVDFEEVRRTLGFGTTGGRLPRENVGSRGPVAKYYSDREMEVVARAYAEDFRRFGYDSSRLPS